MTVGKTVKVKWALGGDEPEDLQEFLSNEEIVKKHGLPAKGVYRFKVKRLTVKKNKNDDDRVSVMLVMAEPKKSKSSKWNGYLVWDGLNITAQSAPFIKRFLKAMGLTWADFRDKTKRDEQDPPHIVQIGSVKFEVGDKDPELNALVKVMPADDYNDDTHLEIARYIPVEDEDEDEPEDDEEEAEDDDIEVMDDDDDEDEDEDEEEEDDEDEDDEDDEEDEDEDDDEEEEEGYDRDDLKAMPISDLRVFAKEQGVKQKKITAAGKKKSVLVDLVAEAMGMPPF